MASVGTLSKLIITACLVYLCMAVSAWSDVQVSLQWDPVADDDIDGYRLFARAGGQPYDYTQPAWEGRQTTCTVTGLAEMTAYYFVVRAFRITADGAVESGDSNEVHFISQGENPLAPALISPSHQSENVSLEAPLTTGPFQDPDPDDYHQQTLWQIITPADGSNALLITTDTFMTHIQLPPFILNETTTYAWTARHFDQNGMISPPDLYNTFTTEPWWADGNKNGVPDDQEVPPEFVIAENPPSDLKCFAALYADVFFGVNLAGAREGVSVTAARAVDPLFFQDAAATAESMPAGALSVRAAPLRPGESIDLNIYFSSPLPDQHQWLSYTYADGFQNHPAFHTLNPERTVLTVRLRDGGPEDLDGNSNGSVVFMGGYGQISAPADSGNSGGGGGGGGGGGCFIESALSVNR